MELVPVGPIEKINKRDREFDGKENHFNNRNSRPQIDNNYRENSHEKNSYRRKSSERGNRD